MSETKRTLRIVGAGRLYWSGTGWTVDETTAKTWATQFGAEKALAALDERYPGLRKEIEVSA